MAKRRSALPKAISEEVLKEFNHRCAACGHERPQLHHIDGDHDNNASQNLIPLCPNCHLVDAHNPTRPIEPGRVRLLRLYHDPTVLNPKFQPIFKRLEALRLAFSENRTALRNTALSLRQFLKVFEKGSFYAEEFERIILNRDHEYLMWGFRTVPEDKIEDISDPHPFIADETLAAESETKLEAIEELIMELLRYQDWTPRRHS